MRAKRVFDLAICLPTSIFWIPLLALVGLLILIGSGWPIFYVSERRVGRSAFHRVIKFRTMTRGIDRILNRATVPIVDQRFLNIHPDSPFYTPIGRIVERCSLTELPQLLHVVTGAMSLVGNRPLPRDVINALRVAHPEVEDRFLVRCGLTGPAQLVGRDDLSDEDRLRLEIAYCRRCLTFYSAWLDLMLLLYTVLIELGLRRRMSVDDVERMVSRSPSRT